MRNDNKLERFHLLFKLFRATYPEPLIAMVQFNYKPQILVVQSQRVNGKNSICVILFTFLVGSLLLLAYTFCF